MVDLILDVIHRDLSMCHAEGMPPVAAPAAPRTVPPAAVALPLLADCCSPLVAPALEAREAETLAGTLKALADPTRLRLISLVAAHQDGEACVCDLTEPVGLTQPTVSHHLKVLVDADILTREQRGRWAYYRLVPRTLDTLSRLLASPAGTSA
jgi:ArsR family transcriptional regulator